MSGTIDSEVHTKDVVKLNDNTDLKHQDPQRKPWDRHLEFILSSIGYAVGLGNVWRFPYIAFKNGGGSFLIPYLIMIVVAGLPALFMESALGQYASQGPCKIYGRLAPAFKGMGFAMVWTSFLVEIYYNIIIAWALFYMVTGFQSELPWSSCKPESRHCHEGQINDTIKENDSYAVGPAEDYFYNGMLGLDKSIISWTNFGHMRWEMVLGLGVAWIIVCISLIRGVQSFGKVVYFTATFPYLMLISMLAYGLTLDGAISIGIKGYITPDFDKLTEISVWKEAAIQIILSLSAGLGGVVTLNSYNKFNNNCHRDAIAIVFINCGTSILAGFVVFAYLGFMAHFQGLDDVSTVVDAGIGLVFKVYPQALTEMGESPIPQIMSFLFFIMLITVGLGSMLGMTETVTTAIMDQFPKLNRAMVVIATSIISFVLGLSMCMDGGYYMLDLIDKNGITWNILLIVALEMVLVGWIYGANNVIKNLEEMGIEISKPMKLYWKACWCFITPLVLFACVIFALMEQSIIKDSAYTRTGTDWNSNIKGLSGTYNENGTTYYYEVEGNTTFIYYVYPDGSEPGQPNIQALGWMIALTSLLILPIFAAFEVYKRIRRGKEWRGFAMFQPTENWKPATVTTKSTNSIID